MHSCQLLIAYNLRRAAFTRPYVVVAPEYRLAPEHPYPAAVVDSYAVMKWALYSDHPALAAHAGQSGSRTIVVGGDSAGGNLAAVLALLSRDNLDPSMKPVHGDMAVSVAHQLLVYPALYPKEPTESARSLGEAAMFIPPKARRFFVESYTKGSRGHGGGGGDVSRGDARGNEAEANNNNDNTDSDADSDTRWRRSPLLAQSHASLPSATFVHAGLDPLFSEGKAYAALLRANGVRVAEHEETAMPHGFFGFTTLNLKEMHRAINASITSINAELARQADGG